MTKTRDRVTLELHPNVGRMVDELHAKGLFGITRTAVVDRLFLAGLRDAEANGWTSSKPPKKGRR